MATQQKAGASWKGYQHMKNTSSGKYKRQGWRTAENKTRAWTRHLNLHPNDLVNAKILKGFLA
jgi:hypothetical protein